MTYESLIDEASNMGLVVKEKPLESSDGRIKNKRVAIRSNIDTSSRKMCVLAEELGHYHTTIGDISDQRKIENLKQEHRARVWAYQKLLSIDKILEAASKGYTEVYDMAGYLDVDEEFLRDYLAWQGILDISL
ncbi:MAG: hypothetical protein RSA49_05420 [Anaerovoracaceae bacterium]